MWLSVIPAGVESGTFDQDLSCAGGFCLQDLWSREEAGQPGGVHSKSTYSHVCHQSTDVLLRGGLGPLYHLSTGKLSAGIYRNIWKWLVSILTEWKLNLLFLETLGTNTQPDTLSISFTIFNLSAEVTTLAKLLDTKCSWDGLSLVWSFFYPLLLVGSHWCMFVLELGEVCINTCC